ncbi:MAG: DUF3109 family protein [Polyangia bacterium]
MARRSLPVINNKRSPSRRKGALESQMTDLAAMPVERYTELQRSIGRMMSIGKVDVDIDQLIERGFLCDRHRCIQWTPHENKANAKPIIDRSCCASYTVPLTEGDRKKVEEILPLVRKRLAANHALVQDEDEPFYDIDDDFSLTLRETDKGVCEFVLYEEGNTTCAVHKTCLEEGLDVWDYKPIGCSLWPVAIVDYEYDGKARYLLTAYNTHTSGLFENGSEDEEGEDKFACIVDDRDVYDPLYKAQEGILRFLFGDTFYDELDKRAKKHLAEKAKRKKQA